MFLDNWVKVNRGHSLVDESESRNVWFVADDAG